VEQLETSDPRDQTAVEEHLVRSVFRVRQVKWVQVVRSVNPVIREPLVHKDHRELKVPLVLVVNSGHPVKPDPKDSSEPVESQELMDSTGV